jgi:hypothetical protein
MTSELPQVEKKNTLFPISFGSMTILRNVLVILAIAASADAMSSTVLPGYKTQFRVVKKGDSERFDRCILEIAITLVVDGWSNSFMPNTD